MNRARDYRSLVPELRDDLLAAQIDTRKLAKFSVAVIVTGVLGVREEINGE